MKLFMVEHPVFYTSTTLGRVFWTRTWPRHCTNETLQIAIHQPATRFFPGGSSRSRLNYNSIDDHFIFFTRFPYILHEARGDFGSSIFTASNPSSSCRIIITEPNTCGADTQMCDIILQRYACDLAHQTFINEIIIYYIVVKKKIIIIT